MKRLSQKPEQLEEYDRVIKDELDKGIIERVDQSEKAQHLSSGTLFSPSLRREIRQVNN